MKSFKSITAAITGIALACCLACALAPSAFAAAGTNLAAGEAAIAAQGSQDASTAAMKVAAKAKKAPTPKVVKSVKAVFKNGKTFIQWPTNSKDTSKHVWVSWKAPKKVKGLKSQTYTVRYSEDVSTLDNAKVKTTSKTSIKLPRSSARYVQIRTNAKYGKKTVRSKWVSYGLSFAGGGGSSFSNGVRKDYYTSYVDLSKLDNGKPGSYEASILEKVPRALKLSGAKLTSSKKGTVKASWKKPKAVSSWNDSDYFDWNNKYDIRYSYYKSMKNAKEITGVSGTSKTIKGLKKGKKVYVQVRACWQQWNSLGGSWYDKHSRWSTAKSIKMPSKRTWVEEKGHWETVVVQEAWDEPIYETHAICQVCGVDLTASGMGNMAHAEQCGGHADYVDVQVGTTHHDAVTEKQWVVDVPGHWE